MFIRPCYRKKNGKRHAYWALVESYRTERGPRQRVVAYLGQLDEQGRLGVKETAEGRPAHRQRKLFEDVQPQWVEVDASRVRVETFILCRSRDRREKEKAMHERFEKRIEEGLQKIESSCGKQKCDPVKIATGVGKLMGHNSRAAGLFDVDIKTEPDGRAKLVWQKVEAWRNWAQLSEGCYLLRSNVTDWSAEDLWKAYIQLTEAEAAFRIYKSDLRIRPIWHQKDERVLAHILVCFIAYVLWKMLGELCRAAGLGSEPRRVFAELGKISVVDVVLPTRSGIEIRRRCITRPDDHQAILLQRLGLQLPSHLENTIM